MKARRRRYSAAADETLFTYRGDTRSPDVVFNEGFQARGDSEDLLAHAFDNKSPPSNFMSTSKSLERAADFSDQVYVVRAVDGIDVNAILGSASPYPFEQEIAIQGGIVPGNIRAVTMVSEGISYLNPNWVP